LTRPTKKKLETGGHLFTDFNFYLALLLTLTLCFIPDLSLKYFLQREFPKDYQILLEEEYVNRTSPKSQELEESMLLFQTRKYGTTSVNED